ncbi:MAG: hypothetical protein JNM76_12320 [Betaproteobacteria bacterium]|nr:hypothetical protein [Betaproteobacteria bacterium]
MAAARAKGYTLISVISAHSWPGPSLTCGENCFIADGASIEPGATLGEGVYVWSNAIVGHHATVGDHAWIAAGSAIGGGAQVGARCFVALNATIGNEVEIGEECLLGARTLTTRNLPHKAVVIERDSEPIRLTSDQFLRISKLR